MSTPNEPKDNPMSTPCQPHVNPMSTTMLTPCQPHANPMPTPCQPLCQPQINPKSNQCQPLVNPHVNPKSTYCQPHDNPCQPHANHMPTTCQPHVKPMSNQCQPKVNPKSTQCQLHVNLKSTPSPPKSTPSQPHVNLKSTTCQPQVNHMSTSSQPHVNPKSTTCQPKSTPRQPHVNPSQPQDNPKSTTCQPHVNPSQPQDNHMSTQVNPKSTPSQPHVNHTSTQVNPKSTPCQPQVNPKSTTCPPQVNDMSTPCQPQADHMSTAYYFRCPSSFCVPNKYVNDRNNNCPFGEDEMLFTPDRQMCKAYVTYLFRDMCFNESSVNKWFHLAGYKKYNVCSHKNCYSFNRITRNKTKEAILFQIPNDLYNISNYFMPQPQMHMFSYVIDIIGFHSNNCKIKRFDQAFQTWKLSKLVVLDISSNDITNSSHIETIRDFSSLTLLNMSFNKNFKVQRDFSFPNSIEILDLSHTGLSSLPKYIFKNLQYLRHLNLSHTMIFKFKHIGIPEYFHLDSLDLRGVSFKYLKSDFFKGLTIRHSLRSSDYKICCPQVLNVNITRDKCEAPDDVISSCSHLIGDTFKRIVIWIVGMVTLIGNSIVLIFRLGWDRSYLGKSYGLFIIGLAASDFLMGIYLLIIAATDIYYRDNFVLEDIHWRYSHVCNLAGFLATLSSETSTFFICLATLDRFLIVKSPLGQLRITRTLKWSFFILSWLFAFAFALTPVIVTDWEIYCSNGLCLTLPLSSKRYMGWQYSVAIFVILNFLLFILIAIGQVAIFISLRHQNSFLKSGTNCEAMKSRELTVAKKLALVALSDFLCWFPVGILGMLSLNGQLFDNEVYAWVAVFVLPVNSALNPNIYIIPVVVTRLRSYVVNES
ncbi:hypothetical protein Btru_031312 [Bulinus truncatus]|nr:hypothetical protein Btru_031312 [Bulinus truncatus]